MQVDSEAGPSPARCCCSGCACGCPLARACSALHRAGNRWCHRFRRRRGWRVVVSALDRDVTRLPRDPARGIGGALDRRHAGERTSPTAGPGTWPADHPAADRQTPLRSDAVCEDEHFPEAPTFVAPAAAHEPACSGRRADDVTQEGGAEGPEDGGAGEVEAEPVPGQQRRAGQHLHGTARLDEPTGYSVQHHAQEPVRTAYRSEGGTASGSVAHARPKHSERLPHGGQHRVQRGKRHKPTVSRHVPDRYGWGLGPNGRRALGRVGRPCGSGIGPSGPGHERAAEPHRHVREEKPPVALLHEQPGQGGEGVPQVDRPEVLAEGPSTSGRRDPGPQGLHGRPRSGGRRGSREGECCYRRRLVHQDQGRRRPCCQSEAVGGYAAGSERGGDASEALESAVEVRVGTRVVLLGRRPEGPKGRGGNETPQEGTASQRQSVGTGGHSAEDTGEGQPSTVGQRGERQRKAAAGGRQRFVPSGSARSRRVRAPERGFVDGVREGGHRPAPTRGVAAASRRGPWRAVLGALSAVLRKVASASTTVKEVVGPRAIDAFRQLATFGARLCRRCRTRSPGLVG